jgi:hypothetical protein
MLSSGSSPRFVAEVVVPFLELLGCESLSRGACQRPLLRLLSAIYSLPGLLECLLEAVQADCIKDLTSVSWFLQRMACHENTARCNPVVKEIGACLVERNAAGAKGLAIVLEVSPYQHLGHLPRPCFIQCALKRLYVVYPANSGQITIVLSGICSRP